LPENIVGWWPRCGWLGHRVCYSCRLRGPKSALSGNRRTLIALRRLLLIMVSTPLRIVNRCCSGFPVSGSM